jgi:hypothetical protein
MSDTQTLVQQCYTSDAASAADTLNALLGPRIVDAIQNRKVEVARSIYGAPESVEDQTDEDNTETAVAGQEEQDEDA